MRLTAGDLANALKTQKPYDHYLNKAFPIFKEDSYCHPFDQRIIPILEKYKDFELIGFGGHALAFNYYDRILKISVYFNNIEVYQKIQAKPSPYYGNIINLELLPDIGKGWPEYWLIIEQEKLEIPEKITLPIKIFTKPITLYPITAPKNYNWKKLIQQLPDNSILHKLEKELNESSLALSNLKVDVPKYNKGIDWWVTVQPDGENTQIDFKNILLKENRFVLFDYSNWQIKLSRKEKKLARQLLASDVEN